MMLSTRVGPGAPSRARAPFGREEGGSWCELLGGFGADACGEQRGLVRAVDAQHDVLVQTERSGRGVVGEMRRSGGGITSRPNFVDRSRRRADGDAGARAVGVTARASLSRALSPTRFHMQQQTHRHSCYQYHASHDERQTPRRIQHTTRRNHLLWAAHTPHRSHPRASLS